MHISSSVKLPFTEVVIKKYLRNNNKKEHGVKAMLLISIYLIPQSPSLLTKPTTYPIMSSIMFSGSMLFGDISGTYLHFFTPSSIICVFTTIYIPPLLVTIHRSPYCGSRSVSYTHLTLPTNSLV